MRFNFTCKHLSVDPTNACEIESRTERNDTFVFVSKRVSILKLDNSPPSPSLLACPLAPGYLLLARRWCPMSPTPKHAHSSEDAPFGPASSNGVFAGRVVGRISLPRRRSCLVGAWRDADFAIVAISITTKPRQSVVPRTNLAKFVGVAGAGSESGLPPSFSTAVACVLARLESLEVQRGGTKVEPDPIL